MEIKDNNFPNKKIGFNGQKGKKEKTMDREIVIVLLRSCGYSIPNTPEEWKDSAQKLANFLESLDVNQRNSVVRPARRVADDRVRITNEGILIDENKLNLLNEYIPLSESKENDLDVFTEFTSMKDDEQRLILEAIQMGIAGQQKALQHLEKDQRGMEL